jgi:hypothetical protein
MQEIQTLMDKKLSNKQSTYTNKQILTKNNKNNNNSLSMSQKKLNMYFETEAKISKSYSCEADDYLSSEDSYDNNENDTNDEK